MFLSLVDSLPGSGIPPEPRVARPTPLRPAGAPHAPGLRSFLCQRISVRLHFFHSAIIFPLAAMLVTPYEGASQERYPYVDELPTPVRRVLPEYPSNLPDKRPRGVVVIDVLVAADGSVRATRVLRSCPPFDSIAQAAARMWRFSPGRANGTPVAVHVAIPFTFMPPGQSPSRAEAETRAGMTAEIAERWQDAIDHYLSALRAENTNPSRVDYDLQKRIIGLSRRLGQSPATPASAESAFASAWRLKGGEETRRGRRQALEAFEFASREAPWWGAPYLELAGLQEVLGDSSAAVRSLRLYLLASPDAANRDAVESRIERLGRTPR